MVLEFFKNLIATTKETIINLVKTELNNSEKKTFLDKTVTDWANLAIDKLKVNIVIKILLNKYLIPNIPSITQLIFDLLKSKVEGLTK